MPVRKLLALIALIVLLAGGASAALAWFAWDRMHEPYKGYSGREQFVTIRQGAGSAEIGRRLSDAQIVSDPRIFRAALWWTGPLEAIEVVAWDRTWGRALRPPPGSSDEARRRVHPADYIP